MGLMHAHRRLETCRVECTVCDMDKTKPHRISLLRRLVRLRGAQQWMSCHTFIDSHFCQGRDGRQCSDPQTSSEALPSYSFRICPAVGTNGEAAVLKIAWN